MPFFIECRSSNGVTLATDFFNKLGTADLLVISLQNSDVYSAAFKKFDWISKFTLFKKMKPNNGYFARSKRPELRFRNRENRLPFKAPTASIPV
jgi:hypothetical protein